MLWRLAHILWCMGTIFGWVLFFCCTGTLFCCTGIMFDCDTLCLLRKHHLLLRRHSFPMCAHFLLLH